MTRDELLAALAIPPNALVGQRVPKKLLLENGAPTAADKRRINEGIEEIQWVAALKPATVGVPAFKDETREYLEIAIIALTTREGAKKERLEELIHRAVPYPVLLLTQNAAGILCLSLAHLRWSHGDTTTTVLDGEVRRLTIEGHYSTKRPWIASMAISSQPREHLMAFYEGWIQRLEAAQAAHLTGHFSVVEEPQAACGRRAALADHHRISQEIASLRAQAQKEKQLNRRVDLNLRIKALETDLAETRARL